MSNYEKMEELKDALDEAREDGDRAAEAAALHGIGSIYFKEKVYDAAEDFWGQSRDVCRETGQTMELAQVLTDLGDLAAVGEKWETAVTYFEEALDIYRRSASPQGEARILDRLGDVSLAQRDEKKARSSLEAALNLCRSAEDRIGGLYFLDKLIPLYKAVGLLPEVESAYREFITCAEKIGDRERMALGLVGLADHFKTSGRAEQASAFLEYAHDLYLRLGRENEAGLIRTELANISGKK